MGITAVNPTNGAVIRRYPEVEERTALETVERVHAAHVEWRRTSFEERAAPMRRAASLLRDRAREWGELMTREMGKPLADGVAEAEKCAWVCDYYADNAAGFLEPVRVETDARASYWTYQPLGVILAVMPWNFPFWQVFRFAAPNLMAGNGAILKHAANVPGCAMAIEEILVEAGFREHLFQSLLMDHGVAERVIEHPLVRGVTLTGSVGAGRAVAQKAGALLKKTVLELGGSDAYVILEDADVDAAARTCAASRLLNSGQSCIAAKRFVVVQAVHDDFVDRLVHHMKAATLGDPMKDGTDVGPLAREDLRDAVHEQVRETVEGGAELRLGGEVPEREGWWYPPTVLDGVQPGTPAYDDEIFGPVAGVIAADDEADAIRIANDTSFGLGAAVFTEDLERGERIARDELEAGCCFVNGLVRSDPRLPFGGVKDSGYGRELSPLGIREFTNAKTVWVDG